MEIATAMANDNDRKDNDWIATTFGHGMTKKWKTDLFFMDCHGNKLPRNDDKGKRRKANCKEENGFILLWIATKTLRVFSQ